MTVQSLAFAASEYTDLEDAAFMVQNACGITDGGPAAEFFDLPELANNAFADLAREEREALLRKYIAFEVKGAGAYYDRDDALNFFEHVERACVFQRRAGEVDSALLAAEFSERWDSVFPAYSTDQNQMDALNEFISHVCRAARWRVERENADRDNAVLQAACEAATPDQLVHLVTVTEASGDDWRVALTVPDLGDAELIVEACKAARLDASDRSGRTTFSSGEIDVRFADGQRVFIGVGL